MYSYLKNIFLLLLSLCACSNSTDAQSNQMHEDDRMKTSIDSLISSSIAEGVMPGAVVAVVRDDSITFIRSWGYRSLIPDTLPMTDSTLFDLASLTKPVVIATAIMQLAEEGKLSLKDRVDNYVEDFIPWTEGSDTAYITIENLLTHSSGLDPYVNVSKFKRRYGSNPDSLVSFISKNGKRRFKPGTRFLYSCLNFVVLQNILQNVTGESLSSYSEKCIFAPLRMTHTRFCADSSCKDAENVAATEVQKDGKPLVGVAHDPLARELMNGVSGNAGLFSTAGDLARFCSAIMNHGDLDGNKILNSGSVDLLLSEPATCDTSVGRALGWDKRSSHSGIVGTIFRNHNCVCHTGYTGTSIVIDLDCKVAVILLTNRVHPRDRGSLKYTRSLLADIVATKYCSSKESK